MLLSQDDDINFDCGVVCRGEKEGGRRTIAPSNRFLLRGGWHYTCACAAATAAAAAAAAVALAAVASAAVSGQAQN